MTNRISRLKTALFANTREISLERALLYTASHRQTEGEPVILRRAKATAYILEHVEISIRDEELIAGKGKYLELYQAQQKKIRHEEPFEEA